MEIKSENVEIVVWVWIKGFVGKAIGEVRKVGRQAKKVAKDDPRRMIHSFKFGLALSLVSLFYYFQPLYSSFGVSAMWAVVTVVVVFEFSVGATIGKGINRGVGTLGAGSLGLGAHHLACVTGKTYKPILIALFVFLQAAAMSFLRFFPTVKARYDYGMLISILTFCMISISGLQTDQILDIAQKRICTILIGAFTCIIISIFVCPVWAGEDLHNLVALNLDKLATFFQGFGEGCLCDKRDGDDEDQECSLEKLELGISSSTIVGGLNSIIDSKHIEETLANFARWEPGHGRFLYHHPWKQYLKISGLIRQCASHLQPVSAYLTSKSTAPEEVQALISSMSLESAEALKELSYAVKTMAKPYFPNAHISNLKIASKNLHSILKSGFGEDHANLLQVMPLATVASLLNDTVTCVENIAEAVDELSSLAHFKVETAGNKDGSPRV